MKKYRVNLLLQQLNRCRAVLLQKQFVKKD